MDELGLCLRRRRKGNGKVATACGFAEAEPLPQPPPRNGEGEKKEVLCLAPPPRFGEGVGGRGSVWWVLALLLAGHECLDLGGLERVPDQQAIPAEQQCLR